MNCIRFLILGGILSCFISNAQAQLKVKLSGVVQDRKSDTLLLLAVTTSTRDENKIVSIPIKDGKFEYELNAAHVEAYQLVFLDERQAGAWRPIIFFPDTANVHFILNPIDFFDTNVVAGGQANKNYYRIKSKIKERFMASSTLISNQRKALNDAGNYRSKEHAAVIVKLNAAKSQSEKLPIYEELEELRKTGEEYTEAGRTVNLSSNSLALEMTKFKYDQMGKFVDLASYYLLWLDATNEAKVKREVAEIVLQKYPIFKAAFPNHPYTHQITDVLNAMVKIVPGNRFVDFTATALNGKSYTLSEEIKDKVAVIDLWASWCGPCIAKAKELVPIYQKYKNKGFTIVGIAREFKNFDALKFRLGQEKFSWLQLTELNDKNGIWRKYAVGDGGGIQVLVDKEGRILKVNPTAEEVEKYIQKLLKI